MSHKGQMEQGIRSWLEVAGPVGMHLSQQRPLLPMQARLGPGKLWKYRSVYLLEPRKDRGPRLLPLSGKKHTATLHAISDLGWGLCEFHKPLFTSSHDVLCFCKGGTQMSVCIPSTWLISLNFR